MTLCITFGKLVKDEEYQHDHGLQGFRVDPCPEADYDICSEDFTIYPRESIRDGAYSSFPQFVAKYLPSMYFQLGVSGCAKLRNYCPHIIQLPDVPDDRSDDKVLDADRLKWFKYWGKKAWELYHDEAGVMFS